MPLNAMHRDRSGPAGRIWMFADRVGGTQVLCGLYGRHKWPIRLVKSCMLLVIKIILISRCNKIRLFVYYDICESIAWHVS
jgi:hypothetical protein